jgi:hypothetical protein
MPRSGRWWPTAPTETIGHLRRTASEDRSAIKGPESRSGRRRKKVPAGALTSWCIHGASAIDGVTLYSYKTDPLDRSESAASVGRQEGTIHVIDALRCAMEGARRASLQADRTVHEKYSQRRDAGGMDGVKLIMRMNISSCMVLKRRFSARGCVWATTTAGQRGRLWGPEAAPPTKTAAASLPTTPTLKALCWSVVCQQRRLYRLFRDQPRPALMARIPSNYKVKIDPISSATFRRAA